MIAVARPHVRARAGADAYQLREDGLPQFLSRFATLSVQRAQHQAAQGAMLSMRQKSVTVDEIMYIAAGFYHLETGDS